MCLSARGFMIMVEYIRRESLSCRECNHRFIDTGETRSERGSWERRRSEDVEYYDGGGNAPDVRVTGSSSEWIRVTTIYEKWKCSKCGREDWTVKDRSYETRNRPPGWFS